MRLLLQLIATSKDTLTLDAERVIRRVAANKLCRFVTKRSSDQNEGRLIVNDESSAPRPLCTGPTEPATAISSDG
jgi:hypothetical protein